MIQQETRLKVADNSGQEKFFALKFLEAVSEGMLLWAMLLL